MTRLNYAIESLLDWLLATKPRFRPIEYKVTSEDPESVEAYKEACLHLASMGFHHCGVWDRDRD